MLTRLIHYPKLCDGIKLNKIVFRGKKKYSGINKIPLDYHLATQKYNNGDMPKGAQKLG